MFMDRLAQTVLSGGVFLLAVAGNASAAENALKDVQIGEEGRLVRIALICERACDVSLRPDNIFSLANLSSDLEIPLSSRSELLRGLRFESQGDASTLSLIATRGLKNVSLTECNVEDASATCIDLEFVEASLEPETFVQEKTAPPTKNEVVDRDNEAVAAVPVQGETTERDETRLPGQTTAPLINVTVAPSQKPAVSAAPTSIPSAPAIRSADPVPTLSPLPDSASGGSEEPAIAPRPRLREAPNRDVLTFSRFTAPERLAIPTLAVVKPASPSAVDPVSKVSTPRKVARPAFSLRDQAQQILGKSLGIAECHSAQARLNDDAWALSAMIDVGFCKAAASQFNEADELFSRLLAYTPDNYQALVGRALIAVEVGRVSEARLFFQDALNAAPPLEQSDQIIAAMQSL